MLRGQHLLCVLYNKTVSACSVGSKGEGGLWSDRPILTVDNQTVFAVHDLHPYTAYSFRVTAVNGMGASPPGEPSYHIVTLREGESRHISRYRVGRIALSW